MFYYPLLDKALRAHDWKFAITRQTLAASAETNNTTYEYMYQLPEDPECLKVLKLIDENNTEKERYESPYIVEGRYLYTDLENAKVKYIGRITDVTKMDSSFAEYFSMYLASKIAFRLTNDVQKEAMTKAWAEQALEEAISMDAEEEHTDGEPDSWTDPWGNV